PVARLAPDHPRREGELPWTGNRSRVLSAATSNALRGLTREQGATLFMTLMAAFQTLLHRHTGAGAVVVGTPIANRHRYEIESLIGFFVNTLALASDFTDDPPFRELLSRLREATLGAYAHQDLPFEKVVEALAPDRSAGDQPLFQAFFAFQNAPLPPLEMPGLKLRPLAFAGGRRSPFFELVLGMSEMGEHLVGNLDYDATLFEEATIDLLFDHFQRLLEEIAADPDRRVGDLALLSEVERREILAERSRIDPGSEVWDELRKRMAEAAPPLYLLDRKLRLVPVGGQGEIYLEGIGVAEGDPAAVAAAWRPHPFAAEPGGRLRATGLRGRWRVDGGLELVVAASREPAEARPETTAERLDKTAAELAAADELRSEFTSREKRLSDARRALLARRLRGRSKKAPGGETT
ncbi:MAG: hypothetical protein GY856_20675, partial [bacterium]|nr:hypothetical protein [bacterium]